PSRHRENTCPPDAAPSGGAAALLPEEDSNPYKVDQNHLSCQLDDPGSIRRAGRPTPSYDTDPMPPCAPRIPVARLGSCIPSVIDQGLGLPYLRWRRLRWRSQGHIPRKEA